MKNATIVAALLGAMLGATLGTPHTAHAQQLVLQPGSEGKDSELVSGDAADSRHGSSSYLIANLPGNPRTIGLLQFDLSALSALPTGAVVTSAMLSLYHSINLSTGTTYDIFRVTSAWDESTVTYNTAPSYDPVAVASLTLNGSALGWRDWDITALVSGWMSGEFANYGLWIEEVPIAGSGSVYFNSSDHSNATTHPRLVIDYTVPVPEPGTVALLAMGMLGVGVRGRSRARARARKASLS